MPLPVGHKFPTTKYRLLRDMLARQGGIIFESAPLAEPAEIATAHDPNYVQAFFDGTVERAVMRRIGFPWSDAMVLRTRASVGGTLAATRLALETGFGGALAGGTHHAFYSEGSGFCVFNDIAVAIRCLLGEKRIAVIDLDVHQGDGTALLFQNEERVFTLSLHGRNNFPFRKQVSSLDVALEDETGDDAYMAALDPALAAIRNFQPDFVFYQAGVDGLAEDKLGKLSLTMAGLATRDRRVFTLVQELGVPLVITIGGGYAEPIQLTAQAHAQTYLLAYGCRMALNSSLNDS